MILIETALGESETELRAAIDQMLASVWEPPESDWWQRYELRRIFEYSSQRYQEFHCLAGSVSSHLIARASRSALPRAIILMGGDLKQQPVAQRIANARTENLVASDVREI